MRTWWNSRGDPTAVSRAPLATRLSARAYGVGLTADGTGGVPLRHRRRCLLEADVRPLRRPALRNVARTARIVKGPSSRSHPSARGTTGSAADEDPMLSCDETGLEIAGLVDNDTNEPPPGHGSQLYRHPSPPLSRSPGGDGPWTGPARAVPAAGRVAYPPGRGGLTPVACFGAHSPGPHHVDLSQRREGRRCVRRRGPLLTPTFSGGPSCPFLPTSTRSSTSPMRTAPSLRCSRGPGQRPRRRDRG